MSEDVRLLLRQRLTRAMKERDGLAVSALRATIAAIENAEAPAVDTANLRGVAIERSPRGAGASEVARKTLTADDLHLIVQREIAERLAAAMSYERAGEADRAALLRAEAAVIDDLGASAT